MKPYSQAWLEELNLSPLWQARGPIDSEAEADAGWKPALPGARSDAVQKSDEAVAPASLPATENSHLHQDIHNRGYLPHLKAVGGIYFVTFANRRRRHFRPRGNFAENQLHFFESCLRFCFDGFIVCRSFGEGEIRPIRQR